MENLSNINHCNNYVSNILFIYLELFEAAQKIKDSFDKMTFDLNIKIKLILIFCVIFLWSQCITCGVKYGVLRDITVGLGCTCAWVCCMKWSMHKWWMSGWCGTFEKLSSFFQIWCFAWGTCRDSGASWEDVVIDWTCTRVTSTPTTADGIHWCKECRSRKVNRTDNSTTGVLSGWTTWCGCSDGTTRISNILKSRWVTD